MNIAFWNLAKNDNADSISHMIKENEIDIALFSEYHSTAFSTLCQHLDGFTHASGYGGCEKITLIAKSDFQITVRRENYRYSIYEGFINNTKYIIVGLHLPANPNSDANDRKVVIRDIVKDVCDVENELKTDKTIIIGDYNASPFDEELVQKDAFNAVLYKGLIEKQEYITHNRKRYRRFYNPMVHYISEEAQMYGSFYYGSGIKSLYWYCYDQVIVRKSLMNKIVTVKYCKNIGKKKLLKEIVPNKEISDHLPLIVTIEGEKNYD